MALIRVGLKRIIRSGWRSLCVESGRSGDVEKGDSQLKSRVFPGVNKWDEKWSPTLQKELEEYWVNRIDERKFEEDSDREKYYILSMFPYPSGNLHMGHVRVYSIGDTLARYHRLKGKNVIHPMGWDAFGLPAENAAMERNLDPEVWTQRNIENMKSVMEKLQYNFDWTREYATCDSDYYKWTQFLFLKLYENDLVYRKEAFVNWDPVDGTVLADEQVSEDGLSWRSGAVVEKKLLSQWFVRTTRYCESLYDGLRDNKSPDWMPIVHEQEKWIGKADGTTFDFEIVANDSGLRHKLMTVWMSNPEFIHKVKFIAVQSDSVWNSGSVVSGLMPYKVRNPLSGDVVPVYATEFFKYPSGRDNYAGMPELNETDDMYARSVNLSYAATDRIIATESELEEHRREICAEARKMGVGGYPVSSRLRDWLISRQRYWGTPIPIIHCENCGPQPVPEEELPVKLPKIQETQKGKKSLKEAKDWLSTKCPKCGSAAARETDTMDTFVDSSWYFLRFLDPDNTGAPFSADKAKKFMPVDLYIGGVEHAKLHLYYARFVSHFLHSAGLLPEREPFRRLLTQGVVRGKTYRLGNGDYVKPKHVDWKGEEAFHGNTGEKLTVAWEKMSKSKHNGVEPQAMLDEFGADTTRMTILTDVAPKNVRDWKEDAQRGICNWQSRVWDLMARFIQVRKVGGVESPDPEELSRIDAKFFDARNYAIDMVGHSLEVTLNINLAIKKLQSMLNDLKSVTDAGIVYSQQFERALSSLVILSAPMAPCYASELWSGFVSAPNRLCPTGEIRWDEPLFRQAWPVLDGNYVSKFSLRKETLKQAYDKDRKKKVKQKAAAKNV